MTTNVAIAKSARWVRGPSELTLAVAFALLALVAGAMSMVVGIWLIAATAGLLVMGAVLVWPPAAALLFIATVPFLAGMERGTLIPLLRPNEAMQFALMAALAARIIVQASAGVFPTWRVTQLDLALLSLALLGSVAPLLWLAARHEPLTFEEIIATVPLWRLLALYVLIRLAVNSESQARLCLWTSVVAANLVALIAIAQVLDAPLVQDVLARYWAPGGTETAVATGRGTATLSSSHAAGDYLAFNLAIALGFLFYDRTRSGLPLLFVPVLIVGTLASAQFSGAIGLLVVLAAVAIVMRRIRGVILGGGVAAIAGGIVLWPAISIRLSEFAERGLPQSWTVRWDNLTTYYIPELVDFGWLLGVRPNSVIEAPELWRTTIFIESGYLWLLWVGGLPLLLGFVWFASTGLRISFQVGRARRDATGVAGLALFSGLALVSVLMLFDPHLTLRGAGDLLYVLMALVVVGRVGRSEVHGPMARGGIGVAGQRPGVGGAS